MSKSGKQFGLILPGKSQLSAPKSSNIFGDDADSDDNSGPSWVKKVLKGEETKSRVKKQTRLNIEKAMADDPTIFQYDELYDNMEREKNVTKEVKKEKNKPKYVPQLIKAAERRKQEHEHRVERMVQKEREAEGEKYTDKESFVTSAYREKLEEFRKMEAEQERMDRIEAICDVTKQQDMSGFYRQMYAQKFNDGDDKSTKKEPEEESSRVDELDKDTLSAGSSSSSEDDDEKTKSNFQSRKSRQYRKRAVEEESESDNDDNESKEEREKTPPPSKKTRSSVEPEQKKKIPSPDDKIDGKTNPEPTKINLEAKNEEKQKKKKKKKEEIVEKIKVSIWEKRTVGKVLDDALLRYLARKALRASG